MKPELASAINFILGHLYNKLPRRRVDIFAEELEKAMEMKFAGHWYPGYPNKGSGYRSLRVSQTLLDPAIAIAIHESGLNLDDIVSNLPEDLMVWVDPGEVSYRAGEKGINTVIYKKKSQEPHVPVAQDATSPSTSPTPVSIPSPVTVQLEPTLLVAPTPQQAIPTTQSQQQPPQLMAPQSPPQLIAPHSPPQLMGPNSPPQLMAPHSPPQLMAPQSPPQLMAPQSPPQLMAPQSPPQLMAPQSPPQLMAPQSPPQLLAPQSPPQLMAPQSPPQLMAPQSPPQLMAPQPHEFNYNPEAKEFLPMDNLGTSLGNMQLGSPGSTIGYQQPIGQLGFNPIAPMPTQKQRPVSAPSTSRPSSLTFTAASFAQTKFGSTKLKSSGKRVNFQQLSPTEFANYMKQRSAMKSFRGQRSPVNSRDFSTIQSKDDAIKGWLDQSIPHQSPAALSPEPQQSADPFANNNGWMFYGDWSTSASAAEQYTPHSLIAAN